MMVKEYQNDDLIVYWRPELCTHPAICLRTLPSVFRLRERPWVDINGAEPLEIIRAIDLCPSGALKYALPAGSKVSLEDAKGPGLLETAQGQEKTVTIKPVSGGPFLVDGQAAIVDADGKKIFEATKMALCGCGRSCNKPFCDGTHTTKEREL